MHFKMNFSGKNFAMIVLSILLAVSLFFCGLLIFIRTKDEKKFIKVSNKMESYKSEFEKSTSENKKLQEENENLKSEIETLAEKKRLEAEAAQKAVEQAAANRVVQPNPYLVPLPNWHGGQVCYLTFDDGPSNNTIRNLETLARYNAKATFFVIGNGNLSLLNNIVSAGHAIGLHAGNHNYAAIYSSDEAYFNDLNLISESVKNTVGIESKIVRFPGGSSNTVSAKYSPGIMSRLSASLPQNGYSYFDWNISSGDADAKNVSVSKIVSNVFNGAVGKPTICVLMHDSAVKGTTADALPYILGGLTEMGYRFETLTPECSGFHQRIAN